MMRSAIQIAPGQAELPSTGRGFPGVLPGGRHADLPTRTSTRYDTVDVELKPVTAASDLRAEYSSALPELNAKTLHASAI
jgi:hypothetical protein